MEKIFEIIKYIEQDIESSYCIGYDNNELTLDSAKDSLEYLKEQLKLYSVSKSFTAEDVVNELEDSDHLDDAIQYFKEQIHK